MDITELDGKYNVTTLSDYHGPVPMRSDGVTEIINGTTNRVDDAGVKWTTTLTPISDAEVAFESVADPTDAADDFCLTLPNGDLTRDPVTYKATLKVARKGDKIRLSGQIEHGKVTTVITMTKI